MSYRKPFIWSEVVRVVTIKASCCLTVLLSAFGVQYCLTSEGSRENGGSLGALKAASSTAINKNFDDNSMISKSKCLKTFRGANSDTGIDEVKLPGCIPKQFWLLSRHGARYPGPGEMHSLISRLPVLKANILKNAEEGRGSLSKEVIKRLHQWNMEFDQDLDNHLTPLGEIEMKELAQRFKSRFPSLLSSDFSTEAYSFRHTDCSRTADSSRHFASGLFGSNVKIEIPDPIKDDPVIKFYKTCRKWVEEVDSSNESRKEQQRFRNMPEMKKVIHDISTRLGFKDDLLFDDVLLMFSMCHYENVVHPNHSSPWCNIFNRNEREVMEYDEDLYYYWSDGYGFSINYEQACPPVKNFLDHFRAAMQPGTEAPLGVFHFTHAGLLLKFFARMGLFRDAVPPRADNFSEQFDRQWRSSRIGPFSSNMALVLFSCDDGYKILAYVQEQEVVLPGCDNVLCPMETVLANYAHLADQCDISEICDGFLENYAYCRRRRRRKKYASILESQSQSDISPSPNGSSSTCTLQTYHK